MMNVKERFTKFMEEQVDIHAEVDVTNWSTKEELQGLEDHEDFIYDMATEGWDFFFDLFKEENKLSDEELEELEELKDDKEFLKDLKDDLEFRYNEIVDDYIVENFSEEEN